MAPEIILLFSGKRKSGKDYITDQLQMILGHNDCTIVKISQPIKSHWAQTQHLDLNKLLSDGEYKEKYRLDMIKWSEDERKKDYGCFCRLACDNAKPTKIWIVSDIRRKTDLKWFRENYADKIKTVKVIASDDVRKSRGWIFCSNVDDAESECDLDSINNWDFSIDNNDASISVEQKLDEILHILK